MTDEMKLKVYGKLAKAENAINKASMAAVGAVTSVDATSLTAFATEGSSSSSSTTPVIDISSVDFSGLTNAITSMVPQILPVVVTILGIRKAISFMMSTIRGA